MKFYVWQALKKNWVQMKKKIGARDLNARVSSIEMHRQGQHGGSSSITVNKGLEAFSVQKKKRVEKIEKIGFKR